MFTKKTTRSDMFTKKKNAKRYVYEENNAKRHVYEENNAKRYVYEENNAKRHVYEENNAKRHVYEENNAKRFFLKKIWQICQTLDYSNHFSKNLIIGITSFKAPFSSSKTPSESKISSVILTSQSQSFWKQSWR